ncbi:hypothetical protein ACFLS7_06405 [Bacteroidota bacterium]
MKKSFSLTTIFILSFSSCCFLTACIEKKNNHIGFYTAITETGRPISYDFVNDSLVVISNGGRDKKLFYYRLEGNYVIERDKRN